RGSFRFARLRSASARDRRRPLPLPGSLSLSGRRADATESRVHRQSNSLRMQADQERSRSAGPQHPFAATAPESSCHHDAATLRETEARSSASEYSTSARPAAPGTKAGERFLSSGNERLRPAESCVLARG